MGIMPGQISVYMEDWDDSVEHATRIEDSGQPCGSAVIPVANSRKLHFVLTRRRLNLKTKCHDRRAIGKPVFHVKIPINAFRDS